MEQTLTLSEILTAAQPRDGGLEFPLAANWTQGRTAYGGYTTAILTDAVQRQHGALPPLRSAMINFTGPVTDSPLIRSELLRQGRNMSTIAARATVGDQLVATGSFSFGQAQQSSITLDCAAPDVPDPAENAIVTAKSSPFPLPAFFGNFEMILLQNALPFTGADVTHLRIWARQSDPAQREGLAGLLAVGDFLPPVVLPRLKVPGVNSSVNWLCNILPEEPQTEDGWWLLESSLSAAKNGYSSQVMRIWNTKRELVVDGMQSVVVFERG